MDFVELQREALLSKWAIYEDQPSATIHAGAHYLTNNCDGSLVATGDTIGSIKVFATSDLSLLYQLSSQDSVLDLSFSIDSSRLYDVRGGYANVWEPNALVCLADSSDGQDNNGNSWSDVEGLAKISLHAEHYFPSVATIISLSGNSPSQLYYYGTGDGVATLCEVGKGRVSEIERLARYMPIEHLVWSDNGRLAVKKIVKVESSENGWKVDHHMHMMVPTRHGHISQLLFQPTGEHLFVSTQRSLSKFDLETHSVTHVQLPSDLPQVKWVCHPTVPAWVLGFGYAEMQVFSWATLEGARSKMCSLLVFQEQNRPYWRPPLATPKKVNNP